MHLLHIPLRRTALAAATLAFVAGCGGSDDPPSPNPNGALGATEITTAQATVEPAATAVDATSAVLTAAQIGAQQSAAVDRATITDTATIAEKQAALDAGEGLTPAF